MIREIAPKMLVSCVAVSLLAACGRAGDSNTEPSNEPGAGEHVEEAASKAGDVLEDVGENVVEGVENAADAVSAAIEKEIDEINALGLTARNLLDEEVHTPNGDAAARLDDILIQSDGRPVLAVLKEGGFFGLGDDTVIVTVQRLLMSEDRDGEVSVGVTLSENELEALGDGVAYLPAGFSVGENVDVSLLSARKLLDAPVYNVDGQKVADIYDFILDREWNVSRVIVSTGGINSLGDHLAAAPWDMFTVTGDETAMRTTRNAVDFDGLPRFRYDQLIDH